MTDKAPVASATATPKTLPTGVPRGTYKTQMQAAKNGAVTVEMRQVAEKEHLSVNALCGLMAKGEVIIPANLNHKSLSPEGIGKGLRTKINVHLGLPQNGHSYEAEMEKARLAVAYKAEAIMDLSYYEKSNKFRRDLIAMSPAMVGTVPVYDVLGACGKKVADLTASDFISVIEAHAKEGVDFMTIHAGLNRRAVEAFKRDKRMTNMVSRGGSVILAYMEATGKENPFFQHYDEILNILREYDVTLNLGDAMRPGSIADGSDASQISELVELGNLTERAWARDVQVMIEGPGHMAINEIGASVTLQKRICKGAPFYVLGPIVTDIALGYDHITSAIGGAVAGSAGADILCCITPAEHLRHPDIDDIKEGIIATKISAHSADMAKNVARAKEQDGKISDARAKGDFSTMLKYTLDPEKAKRYHA